MQSLLFLVTLYGMQQASLNIFDNVHATSLPTLLINTDSGLVDAANHQANLLLEASSLVGMPFADLLGTDLGKMIVFTEAVDHYGEGWTREISLKTRSGKQIDAELHSKLISNDQHRHLIVQIIDLEAFDLRTQQVVNADLHNKGLMEWNRARDFFREMESDNQLLLDAAGEGIYGINLEGKTTFVNRAAQHILGWTADDLMGQDIHAMIHHHHSDGSAYPSRECPIYHSFRNEKVARIEGEVFWHKDGRPIEVEYTSTPIYDQQVLAGAVVVFRDVTDRRENERKLHLAMEQIDTLRGRLEQENEYLQAEIQQVRSHYDLVGGSPAIQRTLAQIDLVSNTESNVLITGESGTGKALVASAIHKASPRNKRPMIRVNCAGISAASFESELFGHVRGAFSGALHDRTGKIEIANGGTLFLDEVSEVPVDLQGKILKVLKDKSFERLGESRTNKLNVRVIASSTKDLEDCVKRGTFREDLYFFLNVFPIECRPLSERVADIPELTQHFLRLACERLKLQMPAITKANIRQLQDYHWPGNVRELQNVIERGAILSRGEKLVLEFSKLDRKHKLSERSRIMTEEQMRDLQISNIVACLKATKGKVSGDDGAAAILGIRPTTLYSRIKKLGISQTMIDETPNGANI
ncbi:MAG: sigma 54-interacting transcriptional regulator [Ahrensia sp.]